MTEELNLLREALRRVKYEAASLADAQVIALEALTQRPAAQAGCNHVLYETTDADRPKEICDQNGEVVLAMCKLCRKAEVELEDAQQATPEPVGEVVAESILSQWMTECGVYLVEKMGHQWASQTKQADLMYLVKKALSYTRPAPGVSEGFALVPVEPTPEMWQSVNQFAHAGSVWESMLAAAQAKGGE